MENQIRNEMHQLHATTLEEVILRIPAEKVRFNGINQLQRASVWFSTLPLKEENYTFTNKNLRSDMDGPYYDYHIYAFVV